MRQPELIADDEIAKADVIATYDPRTMKGVQLWGQESLPTFVAPGAPSRQRKHVNIELAQEDLPGLLELINRVETVRGSLPRSVARLRERIAD